MAKKPITTPRSFRKFLDEHEQKRKAILDKKEQQKRKEAITKSKQQKKSAKEARSSLKYAKAIFQWSIKFRTSSAGRRVIAALPIHFRPNKSLVFFEWHPGWSYSLSLTNTEIEWYRFGPGSDRKVCKTPEELARAAASETPGMLKAACDAIENGEVLEWIKKDLSLFMKED